MYLVTSKCLSSVRARPRTLHEQRYSCVPSAVSCNTITVVCRLVILDAEDSWAPALVDAGIIEKFYVTDLSDQDSVFANCMASIRRAERVG